MILCHLCSQRSQVVDLQRDQRRTQILRENWHGKEKAGSRSKGHNSFRNSGPESCTIKTIVCCIIIYIYQVCARLSLRNDELIVSIGMDWNWKPDFLFFMMVSSILLSCFLVISSLTFNPLDQENLISF